MDTRGLLGRRGPRYPALEDAMAPLRLMTMIYFDQLFLKTIPAKNEPNAFKEFVEQRIQFPNYDPL